MEAHFVPNCLAENYPLDFEENLQKEVDYKVKISASVGKKFRYSVSPCLHSYMYFNIYDSYH